MATKRTAGANFHAGFQRASKAFPKIWNRINGVRELVLLIFSAWCLWLAGVQSNNCLNFGEFSLQIAGDTNRNATKLTRG